MKSKVLRHESALHVAEVIAGWLDDPSIEFVVNLSAGKDSAATALLLKEWRIPHRRVFADTGWEAKETYAHLDALRRALGDIDVVGVPGGMESVIRKDASFASRSHRWCTRILKLEPIREYCDAIEAGGRSVVSVLGIRADESDDRSLMPTVEDDDTWNGWIWRPILRWSIEDVIEIHGRHGVPLNPLYHRGHDRVGCYPCIMASKNDIRLVAEYAPERIDKIRELERFATDERTRRNVEKPGRYSHEQASFFLTVDRNRRGAMGIDEIVAWSRTERGGASASDVPGSAGWWLFPVGPVRSSGKGSRR